MVIEMVLKTKFYVLVDLLIDSDNDDMLDIIIDNIDFFELYFEDLNYGGN